MAFSVTELGILVGLERGKTLAQIADELYLGQPAVSKALRIAEQRVGIQLAFHSDRRVRLTAAGHEVAHRAQTVLDRMHAIDEFVQELQAGRAGPVRIVSTANPANFVLADIVGMFVRAHPQVDFTLETVRYPKVWDTCLKESYEMGIGPAGAGLEELRANGWEIEHLYDDPITLFVGPLNDLARRDELSWVDFGDQLIVSPFSRPYWSQTWDRLKIAGLSPARTMTIVGVDGVKRFVEAGSAVGMLLGTALRREIHEGRLVALHVHPVTEPYLCSIRPNPQALPIVGLFRQFFSGQVADLRAELSRTF